MKYKTKPTIVDAYQVGSNQEVPHWILVALANDDLFESQSDNGLYYQMPSYDREDMLCAYSGDWIIRDFKGELYAYCRHDFEKRFAPA